MKNAPPAYLKRSPQRKYLEKALIELLSRIGGRYRLASRRGGDVRLEHELISLPRLPEAFEGYRILQITDIHHGPYTRGEDLRHIVDIGNRQQADLVVFTGDFVLNSARYFDEVAEAFSRIQSRDGSAAVLGNHDCREGAEEARLAFERHGIPLLSNQHIRIERQGQMLYLAGVKDLEEDEPDVRAAFHSVAGDAFCILLSHNPDIAEFMNGRSADLIISGHTHGGQFVFPLIGAPVIPNAFRKYLGGRIWGPAGPVYVSRGLGATLLPLRIACPPEMNVLELHCGSSGV